MLHHKQSFFWIVSVLACFFCLPVAAADIPQQLEPWVPWVLHDQDNRLCTSSFDGEKKFCVWPHPLQLEVQANAGHFSQTWEMKKAGWIILPGQTKYWPQQVVINNEPALVVNQEGIPALHVAQPGVYIIQGNFTWTSPPESISIPAGTAIVDFKLNGKKTLADINNNTLWLSGRSSSQKIKGEDTVQTQVYRHINDTIPMVITSQIEVQVSGTPREILIDWQLPENQIPISLHCSLPVKIGTDNRIHMQARPGNYTIVYKSRLPGQVDSLLFSLAQAGPESEYWSFEAHNQLRMVKINSQAVVVDPTQTTLPQAWHKFPSYLIKKGQSLNFETLKRGDPEPAPNRLAVHRTLWLDSNGQGMTIKDDLSGTVTQQPRLTMQSPAKLGRMVINGRDQLITRMTKDGPEGVEVRQGTINGLAVSRIENTTTFPAGGWSQSIHKLSAEVVLPPGWKLLYASGVDSAKTWISQWTLLDCFIVLIIVIATFKLLGAVKGTVALIALVLSYHDRDAPIFIWLGLLACIAMGRAMPNTKIATSILRLKPALLVGLVIIILPYSVEQLRIGFFPQLEKVSHPYSPPVKEMAFETAADNEKNALPQAAGRYAAKAKPNIAPSSAGLHYRPDQQLEQQYDVQSKVQAGPGLPTQKWRVIRLSWSGPVEKELELNLLLSSPLVNLLLILVKVAAVYLLAFFMAELKKETIIPWNKTVSKANATALAVLFTLAASSVEPGYCTAYPSPELLETLRTRLLEPAPCFPDCADLSTMDINLHSNEITVKIQANCSADSAVTLPQGEGIFWQAITVNQQSTPAFADQQNIWLPLPTGQQEIQLFGKVNRSDIQMFLPVPPHVVTFDGQGEWSVAGLDNNSVPEDRLQFIKQETQAQQADFGTSTLPPLMQVERILHLGLQWRVETIVTRLSPQGTAVFLSLPLLAGESVTDAAYKVEDSTIAVNFAPHEQRKTWHSAFNKQTQVTLQAPQTTQWYEIWRINASPIWHVETNGISPIHHHSKKGVWQPVWHPWGNEQLILNVSRPEGIPGSTKTIESSTLKITPGIRSTSMQLDFTIRSTRGDQQQIVLPDGSIVQSVSINGRKQPVKKDNIVVIPLTPGTQKIAIDWRTPSGISALYQVPQIDLGNDSVNANIEIQIGKRWVWFVKGPKMGPAILFYSELLVILLVSFFLGRSKLTPLKSYHWMILGFGLCQSGLVPCLIIVGWFIALKIRLEKGNALQGAWFNLAQIMLVALTLFTIGALVFAVRNGLLGHPDMLIAGNNSSSFLLRWYQDRVTGGLLPQPMVISIPMIAYRVTMLAWALWLAFHLLQWVKWGWSCFTNERSWTPVRIARRKKVSKSESSAES
ncbi:hypothetical protein [Desulfogranum marinum]|uniref:hypothetical protein n=1 Tax=Desulfogranum marinum TaxID=453220 RepID=UPI001965C592|nr:hypothetical protein [Desulfogranum marinum]MBM9512694.1 hypothetical protein [Desulfogranum marinum]